ncbi:MAG: DUF885 domain-containing protein [Burkholderiaceae bacterium]
MPHPLIARPRLRLLGGVALGVALGIAPAAAQSLRQPVTEPTRDATRFHATLEAARLHALLDADYQFRMEQHPEEASLAGDHRFDDRLDDRSSEAFAREDAHARDQLRALRRIDRDALTGEDRISLDCALQDAQLAVERQRFPGLRAVALSSMEGPQTTLPALMLAAPVFTEADAARALARLRAVPRRIAQEIAVLRNGRKAGWVTHKPALADVPAQIDGLLAAPPEQSPLLDPFRRLPATIPADRREALKDDAAAALHDQVAPALLELRRVVAEELLPAAPEAGPMSDYPDGAAAYALLVRQDTTLPLDPKAVNETGLAEMARIRGEIAALMRSVDFDGGFKEFVAFVNHDPRFFYADGDALLAGYRDIAKRVDPMLPRLFLTLPRAPYGVRAIPAWQGANVPEHYSPGAADGSTAGWFNANVVALAERPKWHMEDVFLHEAVPGHHLQLARQKELLQLPLSRRMQAPDAYVEGWALYAEGLGAELGLYTDPYSRYGELQGELQRAARLVVDTGVNALGWTRAQGIAYLEEEAADPPGVATAEVDRYYAIPAQALTYKVGQMKILELRRRAAAALGERFDVRAFHQEILDHGALPLAVLERVIDDWIARTKSAPAAR